VTRLPGPIAAAAGSARGSGARTACRAIRGRHDGLFRAAEEHRLRLTQRSTWLARKSGPACGCHGAALARERIVFEMKHYQGLKLRAIGAALGTSEETVKNSLFAQRANCAVNWENCDERRRSGEKLCGDCTAAGLLRCDEVSAQERVTIEAHLVTCEDCRSNSPKNAHSRKRLDRCAGRGQHGTVPASCWRNAGVNSTKSLTTWRHLP